MQITVAGCALRHRDTPRERGDPVVSSTHTPIYRRPGPFMRARSAPSGGAGVRSHARPSTTDMGLHVGNGVSLDAADDTGDAPHRPTVSVTNVPRDNIVAPERRNA